MNRLALFTLLTTLPGSLTAQAYDVDKVFALEQLREDFSVLRASLEQGHAGLYRYSDKPAIDRLFDVTAGEITGPMTELEFLRLLAPVVAGANDGHTGLSPSRPLTQHFQTQPILFPIKLRFLGGKAYVYRDYTNDQSLVLGGELTHINGRAIDEIVAVLLPMMTSDGRIETSKYKRLERETAFGALYSALYGLTTEFTITNRPGGTEQTVTVRGLSGADLAARLRTRYPEDLVTKPPIELSWRDDVPILTVRTFGGGAYRQARIDYAAFLQTVFSEFDRRDAQDLVIDVRDNGGGSDEYGSLLAAHLLSDEFEYYESLRVNSDSFDFLRYTTMSNDDVPRDRLRANETGIYDFLGHSNLDLQQPQSPTFTGNVYILINGGSFSATGEFTSAVNHNRDVTFVGEESGAGYYGNTSGMMTVVTLPHTRLRVRLPMVRYTMAVSGYSPADRGMIPGHEVIPTIDDVLAGRDAEMEFVLELIARRR